MKNLMWIGLAALAYYAWKQSQQKPLTPQQLQDKKMLDRQKGSGTSIFSIKPMYEGRTA